MIGRLICEVYLHEQDGLSYRGTVTAALLTTLPLRSGHADAVFAQAPAAQSGGRAERTTWFFYKVKWGHQEEFVDLFQKNHYPVLRKRSRPAG